MNIYISSNDVLLVKELIMHKNVEVCSYLLSTNEMKNDDKLAPFILVKLIVLFSIQIK